MLTQKQVNKIREHLNNAQNPLFFFDNDPDGLCSFLLLGRYLHRGKGVAIKGSPELSVDYFRKARELNADYIFILDKPLVSEEFFEEAEKINLPVVWIDHHEVPKEIPDFVDYYNPLVNNSNVSEPVTALCYQITNRKDDLWLAIIGCISDKFFPDFYQEFKKKYPDLSIDSKDAYDILYKSPLGKIERIFRFGLKDKTTNVVKMIKFLMIAKSPYDILEENNQNYPMHKRFKELDKTYQRLILKAVECDGDALLFFKYGGSLSISADLANELSYRFPSKVIVVAYIDKTKGKINISIRGKGVREKALDAIKNLNSATGGGHEDAVGVRIQIRDWENFKEKFKMLVKN